MAGRRRGHKPPTRWSRDQLNADRLPAIADFRDERLLEPAEDYGKIFDHGRGVFETLLESTADLTRMHPHALSILTDEDLLAAFRYVAGPPISADDLKTLVDTKSLSPGTLRNDPDLVNRIVETVLRALDYRRFPWIAEHREPRSSERMAAIQSSTAMWAMRRLETMRRNVGKMSQEEVVRQELLRVGLQEAPNRNAATLAQVPGPGEFCNESYLAGRKADFIVGLWDHRAMPIECKVSNR